jgi:N6-adenosine-specific RNA methylase IME4
VNAAAFPPGIFAPLPVVEGGFQCVVADVPSRFRSNSKAKPGRNAIRHYNCHSMPTIASLPVRNVVARNAFLWFWTTGPLIAIGAHIPVIRAWGFEPTAMGFVWVKLNPKAPSLWFGERDLFFGPGLTTRKNAEYVVLCRRGHPERLAKDVFEIIVAPRRQHSRKPAEVYRRIERYCVGPYLDMFPREHRDGWIPYGDESTKFDAPAVDVSLCTGGALSP